MLFTTEALVLRETQYKDSEKMLTLLSRDRGRLSVSCRGTQSNKGSLRAGTQLLAYSSFTLFASRNSISVNEAEPVELFVGLRGELTRLSLASYIAELLEVLSDADVPSAELLPCGLNMLYALSHYNKPEQIIKAVFELKAISLSGYMPVLECCAYCGSEMPENPLLDTERGELYCGIHARPGVSCLSPLSPEALAAMRFVLAAPPKKLLSFTLDAPHDAIFASACESFLLRQLGRGFSTLDFYRRIALPVSS